MIVTRLTALLFVWLYLCLPARANADIPVWMREAAAKSTPTYGAKVPAVVLLDEKRVKVSEDGRVVATTRYVVRILTREGRGFAVASELYTPDTGRVREIRAWLIGPSNEIREYEKDRVADVAVGGLSEYSEVRRKLITAEGDADARAVFGYESTTEDRSVFTQFEWHFQGRLPVMSSRYELTVPSGWRAEGVTFNHSKIDPSTTGSTYVWELQNLAEIEVEPASPVVTNLAPRLAVSFFPAKPGIARSFDGWRDVSRWLSELNDPQATPGDELAAKARSLTANARSELDRVREIGRYAQKIKYVSIQTGIGRGGGYQPHRADEIFAKGYGDCKDKANLMRAMLKALGITAYPVSIYSGDATYVREEWASPQQFNHCIVAVKVSDETTTLSTIQHPDLGRLLIFDPTDEDTPVGDLPEDEQGSLALIVAGDAGMLLRMPALPPQGNRLEREITATLQPDGTVTASLREVSTGQGAVGERQQARTLTQLEYRKLIEHWITTGATGARITKIQNADEPIAGRFVLDVEFTADRYAQLTGRLFLFKPAIVSRREMLFLTEKTRKHPVVLNAVSMVEIARFKLPEGFVIDEAPDAIELSLANARQGDSPCGSYSASYQAKDGELVCTRKLEIRATTLPPERYEEVQKFFERIRSAELAPIVLLKK
jgi:hypothetical protein